MEGLVISGSNNYFIVESKDKKNYTCSIKGKVLRLSNNVYNPLCPGDIVEIEKIDENQALITSLKERKNEIARLNIKTYKKQTLASNLDLIICVTTPKEPPFRPRFVDRVIVQAEKENIPIIIVMNKVDLQISKDVSFRLSNWKDMGYEVIQTSAKNSKNIEELKKRIEGLKLAVIGQSGVGKSSLLNALDSSLSLKTSSISNKFDRGVHTTTKANLFKIKGGATIIDTPGIRSFSLWNVAEEELIQYFREMKDLSLMCKFGFSCKHEKEKGCAILENVSNNKILYDRYESYIRIKEEIIALKKEIK